MMERESQRERRGKSRKININTMTYVDLDFKKSVKGHFVDIIIKADLII